MRRWDGHHFRSGWLRSNKNPFFGLGLRFLLRCLWGILFVLGLVGRFAVPGLSHRSAGQVDAVRVVDQPVENTVGHCGIANLIVPVSDRHLAGEDRRACRVAIIADFQKVPSFGVRQWRHGPVVDDQNVDASDAIQQSGEAAVGAGDGQILEQTRRAGVEGGESVTNGFLS